MKQKWLLALFVFLTSGLSVILLASKANADPYHQYCGNSDTCTVLVVQLTGSVPNDTVVTAKRQRSMGKDDTVTLVNDAALKKIGDSSPTTAWNSSSSLATNQYTSFFGLYGTSNAGGSSNAACNDASDTSEGTFLVTATSGGKTISKTQSINVCNVGHNPPFIKSVSLAVTSTTSGSSSLGGIKGQATYEDDTNQKSGACDPHSSILSVYGGPDNISQNDAKRVSIASDGSFQSGLVFKPGNYTVSILCYDSPTPSGSGLFKASVDNVPITAGQVTSVPLTNILSSSSGGGLGTGLSGSGGSDDSSDSLDCGSGDWNWVICSGAKMVEKAALGMDDIINEQLTTPVGQIFDTTPEYHTAWSSFRVIAVALIIIAGLVMVVSQALGFELLDAYTIRKVLPRLLIAIIFIAISWPLMRFVVSFFDSLGRDVENLIVYPFKGLSNNATGSIIAFTNPLTLIFVAGGLFFVYGFAIFSFVGTFFLAALLAMAIFAMRQAAIIVLVILAPVAIACYILPNTQKVWQFWRENFLGLMVMYPIITAMIASGRVMSAVFASKAGTDGSGFLSQPLNGFLSLIAYFIPYFFLPFAFKLASGVIGNLAGIVNDRGKGGFDRLKNMRTNAAQKNVAGMKAGNRFSDRNALTRGFNRTTAGVGTGTKGHFGLGARGAQAVDQARRNAATENVMKSPGWAAIQHDDDALRAATYDSAAAARAAGVNERGIAAAQASIGFGRPQAIAAAQQLAATGTGYKNLQDLTETVARASGGSASTASSMAGNINSATKSVGRFDLAPGYGDGANGEPGLNSLIQAEISGNRPNADQYHAASVRAARGADTVSMLRGKPREVENITTSLAHHAAATHARSVDTSLSQAERDAASAEFIDTMGQIDQISQQKSYASTENQAHVNRLLDSTAGLQGSLAGMMGTNNPTGWQGPITPQQAANQQRYNQARAPRQQANDPNLPTP